MNSFVRSISFRWSVLFSLGAMLVGGCASSPMSRIDDNREKYESWPLEVQEAVLNKRAAKGMTEEQVTMAMGKPSAVEHRNGKNGDDEEVWVYKSGGGVLGGGLPQMDVGTGTNIGGVGVYTSKSVGGGGRRSTEDQDEVVFTNGIVTGTDIGAK